MERMGTLTRIEPDRPVADREGSGETIAIRIRGLTKRYRHPWTMRITRGVEDLSLDVRSGEVMGYLGPNGAGKTTTIKLLMGLIKPSSGTASIQGRPIDDPNCRRRVGFLPEQPYFYDYLNGLEYLELAAGLSGVPGKEAARRARHWLGRVGLGDRPRLTLRKYSKGMLQRLGLAAAMAHEPDLLILDEPMSGLDPFGRRDVRELIREQRERGVTVLFSSHILPDVEMLCDRVAIVLQGRLQRVAEVSDLLREGPQTVLVRCAGQALTVIPSSWSGSVERTDRGGDTEFLVREAARVEEVLAWALGARLKVLAVTPQRLTLEELFLATAAAAGQDEPARSERRSA
jgi:ABC-2 type transport system ATP-binding protein